MNLENTIIDENQIELEWINCALCDGTDLEPYLSAYNIRQHCSKEYTVVKCKNCGLTFLNPRPTKKSMDRYYLETDKEKLPGKPAFYEKVYYRLFRGIPLREKGALLDMGCGNGRYIYTLRNNGWDVKGIDMAYTDYGRNMLKLDIYECGVYKTVFQDDTFDVVTLWWVLEHLSNPLEAIREAFRILKENGLLMIGVPNIESFEARFFKGDWFHLFLPKHQYFFSPYTLQHMLGKCGFSKIRIRHDFFSFGFIGSTQCFLNRKGFSVSLNHPLAYALSLPIDVLFASFRNSGLITAYAHKG